MKQSGRVHRKIKCWECYQFYHYYAAEGTVEGGIKICNIQETKCVFERREDLDVTTGMNYGVGSPLSWCIFIIIFKWASRGLESS